MNDPQQNSRDSATHHPASGTQPPARNSATAIPQATPQEGKLEGRGGGDPGPAQAAGRRPIRRKRNDVPDQVLDRSSAASPAALDKSSAGEVLNARNLEAMVQELLEKLHAASKQLKERDHAISRLRQETVVLTRELDAPERNGGDQPSLASLSFFGSPVPSRSGRRPSGGGPAKPLGPEKLPSPLGPPKGTIARTREMRAARPRSQTAASTAFRAGRCPACGHELRKAKCVNVITQLCLRCRGIFIDQRSIRHLARSQNWFRSVERFLSGPAAVTASAQKTGRLSRSRVR